ncbi:hypothetical protein LCA32G_0286 [Lacticaseibacillus paracasei]|nr:hypothetical protein LCA32G_0286 [Lacticaseibacillus paracasei]
MDLMPKLLVTFILGWFLKLVVLVLVEKLPSLFANSEFA